MKAIKETLKERTGGIFLLFLAMVIVTGLSVNSGKAESKNEQNIIGNQTSNNKGEVLGETNDNEDIVETGNGVIDADQEEKNNDVKNDKNASQDKEESKIDEQKNAENKIEGEYYDDLASRLKKYCGKKNDIKKCKDYLIEAKDARNKGKRFGDLYKKYHFEKKTISVSSNSISVAASENIKTNLVIKLSGDSKSYEIESARGISVLELMKQGNISYDILNDGRIDNIGGEKKESGTMSWMLYACKNGTCKMTPVGPSEFKIDGYDKIEWRYLDWMTMGMDDWNTW